MTQRILYILLAILTLTPLHASDNQVATLRKSADKIAGSKCVYVTYSVTADGNKADGQLVIQGDMFTISLPSMKSWYDGRTQWTYSSQIGEVNILTPTEEELQQINPLAIIRTFSTDYKAAPLKSAPGKSTVRLTAKNSRADIAEAEVTIDDNTYYPTKIILTMSNRQKVVIDISSIKSGAKLPESEFKFDSKHYPGINVVDLR